MVLAPQNPFYVLQFAENASKTDDSALALKMYLRAVEMIEDDEDGGFHHDDNDIARRAWSGVDLVSHISSKGSFYPSSGLRPLSRFKGRDGGARGGMPGIL